MEPHPLQQGQLEVMFCIYNFKVFELMLKRC